MTVYTQIPPIEPGVSQKLAQWRAANYSDVRYKLNITLEKAAPLMKGEMEIRVNLTEEGAKNTLVLDWRRTQFLKDKDLPYAEVYDVNGTSITQGSSDLQTFIVEEHIIISSQFLKKGENVIKINFASPIKTSGAAVTRYIDKEDGAEYVYSLFVPSDASMAFPVFDQPDLKARFSLSITFPADWKAITNTEVELESRIEIGHCKENCIQTKLDFQQTQPISTYVFAFAAGNFETFNECSYLKQETNNKLLNCLQNKNQQIRNTSKIYVRKSQAEKFKQHSAETFRLNREAVKYLESYFDFKFPFPKYDLVLIPEFPFGGMEHAGATFLRESSVIFPSEPTANDFISRANVIFHEAAHQWFGDTVTMKWFDDLWLKEGFAEFMAYKTLEKTMPEYNAWKAFYERNKPLAYLTDSTRGTTPIYQEIPNLSAAKSAYGNIVYRKAPSFLRQAEFYLGEDKFQTAVRAFLKKHQYANASWEGLVSDFARVKYNLPESGGTINATQAQGVRELLDWANGWIKQRGAPIIKLGDNSISQKDPLNDNSRWVQKFQIYTFEKNPNPQYKDSVSVDSVLLNSLNQPVKFSPKATFIFPNYQDYGYGIFLLDEKSREYVVQNIRNEKDAFLRSMMWGALWDSVREGELNPKDYVELAIKNIAVETDELTISTILSRVSTAMNYYVSDAQAKELAPKLENIYSDKMQNAPTQGQKITFYRAFLNVVSSEKARTILKEMINPPTVAKTDDSKLRNLSPKVNEIYLKGKFPPLKTKDKFDIVTRLAILGDPDAPRLLADLQKTETGDDAKRYAYAVGAAFPTKEAKEKYFNDFLNNKEISENWIESAFVPFNSPRHAELTLPYLEKALTELPNLKRNRKIFFVNGWLAAFIGGQKDEKALAIISKFLADNPKLDKDLRLKILENVDVVERAVQIRKKW